jgi:LysR family nitrogen assimilation transcriptional regulator
MTLTQLVNFVRVVELQSFSKAAAMVRIAQPALSRQVRALELELGARLLTRHSWGVTPTPSGEVLAEHARSLVREIEAAKDAVHAIASEPRGPVSLGVPASLAPTLLPALSGSLKANYPELKPHLVDSFSSSIHQRLVAGELDIAVLYEDRALGPVIASPLVRENLVLVGPPAGEVDPAWTSAEVLEHLPMILPGRSNRLRARLYDVPGEGPKNIVVEVDSLPAIIQMVERGIGYSILSYSAVAAEAQDGKLAVHDLRSPPLTRTLLLARPAGKVANAAVAAVEDEIRRLIFGLAPGLRWTPLFELVPSRLEKRGRRRLDA